MFPQNTKSSHFKLQKKHVMFTYRFNYTIKTFLKKSKTPVSLKKSYNAFSLI